RSYAMSNGAISVLYLHRRGDYPGTTRPQSLRVRTGPGRFFVRWINPEDGKQVGDVSDVSTGQQFLTVEVPAFSVDLASRIDRTDAPLAAAPLLTAGPALPARAVPAGWKVAWSANLDDPKSENDWLVNNGTLSISDGVLCLRSDPLEDGEATLAHPTFTGDF